MSNKRHEIPKSQFIHTMDELQEMATTHEKVRVKDIFTVMGDEGHAILLIFLCLPYMQPIPIPGLSTVFGALTCLVVFCHYMRWPPYLPKKFQHHEVSAELILKISEVAERLWGRVGKYIHPRWTLLLENPGWRFANFVVLIINAILLSLPLPIPFSNFFPNIAILLLALALMEKDGLFVIASYLWSLLCFAFFIAISLGTVWSFKTIF